jgi:phosphodiesterase/alkaline phosphatase D-like protein
MNRLGIVRMEGRQGGRSRQRKRLRLLALLGVAASLLLAVVPSATSAIAPLLGPTSAAPTASGATLHGTIYPYGLDTHYRFEYGTTTAYGTSVPVPDGDAGSEPYPYSVAVEAPISGLTANTTYHYRLVASNASGPASSGDLQFTTTGPPPIVSDEAATEVSGGFELKGTVNPNGSATTYQFEYGTTASYGSKVPVPEASVGSGSADVPVTQTVSGLLPNTTYHFRLVARHAGNSAATADKTFMTPPAPPSAPTAEVIAPEATASGFELKGAINPNSLATTYHFEFGTTTAYGTNLPATDASVGSGASAVPVEREVTGLLPSTTYHYRIVASNSEGPGVSGDQAFTTPPPKPTVVSLPVSQSADGFTLNASVNPNGGATTYHFEFGVTEAYGQSIPASEVSVGSGSSPVAVSQLVKGLPPGVPYHYRIVAQNAGGSSVGGDQFFMTPAEPEAATGGATVAMASLAPPPLAPPPSPFSVRGGAAKAGKATLSVDVPGAGTVSVGGKQVKAVRVDAAHAGTVALSVKLTAAAKRALGRARGHRLAVKLTITFQPLRGSASTTHKTIVFR